MDFDKDSFHNKLNYDDDLSLAEKEQDLPKEIKEKKLKGLLRTGFTTGTTAAAATKAALYALLSKGKSITKVQISLPKGRLVSLEVFWTKIMEDSVTCAVIKDGGDDPDATHGAEICSTVKLTPERGKIVVDGGKGVGRVTKPGLGLVMGTAAINPVPIKMINQAIKEVLSNFPSVLDTHGLNVIISVPKGEEIAKKTDNPRLGILGGISILGTTGIVLPYSTASFAASIRQSLDVGIALKNDIFVLTTGGRSEDFCKILFENRFPEHSYVQMGDFAGYSIRQCYLKNVKKVIIAGFIGKLTKIAMGVKQTHVRGSHVDLDFMSQLASECNASKEVLTLIKNANTARHVSEIIDENRINGFYNLVCKYAYDQMIDYSNRRLSLEIIMFNFDGDVIGRYPS
ncbi:MAG: cobalt-precorrin-5B (C(1))-methyltransferase [Thermoproteota archaeon]|nr:cobalt-precorrin-5B (C(1))-methyltransferase [Thermoproteota archaeon]